MRLISCHVEGFGAIRCADFAFDRSPTVFNFENGYGKSTLCAFITAMLFGFDTAKANSQKFEDRVHYYPFDGGRFGGSMTLLHEGVTYRIERFFDKKSQTKDVFTLYENDKPCPDRDGNIGKALLGIDRESFLRVVLMDSRDAFLGSTDGINERLGKFSGGESDLAVKDAIARLDAEAKKLKVRGGGGEISRLTSEIARMRAQIDNLNAVEESLDALYEQREKLLAKLRELECAERDFCERSMLEEKRAAYNRLLRERDETEARLTELRERYPSGIPTGDEIAELAKAKREITKTEGAITEMREREASAAKGSEPFCAVGAGAPTEEEIERHRANFAEIVKTEEELSSLIGGARERGGRRLPLLISGGALAAAAIPLALVNVIACIAAVAVGIALIALSFATGGDGAAARIDELNAKKAELTESTMAFLSENGFTASGVLALDFAALEANSKAYNIIKKENEEQRARLKEAEAELNAATLACRAIEEKYAISVLGEVRAEDRLFADRREQDELTLRLERSKSEIADYISAFGKDEALLKTESGERQELSDPAKLIDDTRRELRTNESDIARSEELLAERDAQERELVRLTGLLAEANDRLNVISKTREYLKRADDRMISRYVSPIRERLLKYGAALSDYIGESFSMDRDLNLYFESHGERHTEKHLSQGQHAIVALCMRLAISEVIFGEDNCFIILDDPFVALDEKHFKNVADLIKKLAKNRQIVYFTCHNSRNV